MKSLRYIFLVCIALSLFSCKKFKGSQEIPAYLRIEPWSLTTNYDYEGAATYSIPDAWVYIDGNLHGCFEMKSHDDGLYAMIPVLKEGTHKLQIYPGVKLNGISSTRIQYPFYKPYVTTQDLTQGDINTIMPSTKYYSADSTSMRFRLLEDFEDANNIKIDSTVSSQTKVRQISHRTNQNAWVDPYDTINHYRSGWIHLGDSIKKFDIACEELTDFPGTGKYTILEMDYKCSTEMLIGMYIMSAQDGISDKELYYVKASDTWKKIYINFSPTVTENYNASYMKFYIRGTITSGSADFYFDNIKLIYRE